MGAFVKWRAGKDIEIKPPLLRASHLVSMIPCVSKQMRPMQQDPLLPVPDAGDTGEVASNREADSTVEEAASHQGFKLPFWVWFSSVK